MPYNNGDQAVIIPQNQQLAHFASQIYEDSRRDKLLAEQQAEDTRQRQDTYSRFITSEFDNKHFLTGTGLDPVINKRVAGDMQKYLSMLAANPKMSNADLNFLMQNDIGDINAMSSGIKSARANIEEQAKAFSKYPGIDANAAKQLALTRMIYDIDPVTGAKKPKDLSKFDPSVDYFSEVIKEHPDLITQGDLPFRDYTKTYQSKPLAGTNKGEYKGVTTLKKYTGSLPAYAEEVYGDAKHPDWVTGVKVRSEQLPNIKNADGSPMEVADKDVYNSYITHPGASIFLLAQLKQMNNQLIRSGKSPISADTPSGEIALRKILYDKLTYGGGMQSYNQVDESSNNNMVDKNQLGIPQSYRTGVSDAVKAMRAEDKSNQKLEGTDLGFLMKGLDGDPDVLASGIQRVIKGKTYYDITGAIGGMKLGRGADGKPVEATGVLIDPVSGTVAIEKPGEKVGADPIVNEYKGMDIRRFFATNAGVIGSTPDKVKSTLNLHMDASGNRIGKQDPEIVKQRGISGAQERRQAQQNKARIEKAKAGIEEFKTSGDLSQLNPTVGLKLNNGATLTSVKNRAWYKPGKPYYIEMTGPDGKTITVDFDSKYEAGTYIETQTQQN